MNVTGPGSPAYGAAVNFTVRNTGETTTATLAAPQLSNATNFDIVSNGCASQALGYNATCVIGVRPKAAAPGPFSGTLIVSDGTIMDDSTLAGTATGWPCSPPWGGSVCFCHTGAALVGSPPDTDYYNWAYPYNSATACIATVSSDTTP